MFDVDAYIVNLAQDARDVGAEIGKEVYISEHAWLNANDFAGDSECTLSIGDGTYVGRFVHVNAWKSVVIENNVLIADRVFISDADHCFENIDIPIRHQGAPCHRL